MARILDLIRRSEPIPAFVLFASFVSNLPLFLVPLPLFAHRPATSKHTFEADIQPIFFEHCGGCHRPDGPAPMSLLDHASARPWAEAIREEVLLERMPPWGGLRGALAVAGKRALSAQEIDRIVTWASGGAPRGKPPASPSGLAARSAPDQETSAEPGSRAIALRHLPASGDGGTAADAVDLALARPLWLRGLRFAPGAPRWVRRAEIRFLPRGAPAGGGGAAGSAASPILEWGPGDSPWSWPPDCGLAIPADASIAVELAWKRPWDVAEDSPGPIESRAEVVWSDTPPARRIELLAQELRAPSRVELPRPRDPAPAELLALVVRLEGRPPAAARLTLGEGVGGASRELVSTLISHLEWPQRFALREPFRPLAGPAIWLELVGASAGPAEIKARVQLEWASAAGERR